MKPTNPNLAHVGMYFKVHSKPYRVINFGYREGENLILGQLSKLGWEEIWVIKNLSGGENFIKTKKELDETLKKHKHENKHV